MRISSILLLLLVGIYCSISAQNTTIHATTASANELQSSLSTLNELLHRKMDCELEGNLIQSNALVNDIIDVQNKITALKQQLTQDETPKTLSNANALSPSEKLEYLEQDFINGRVQQQNYQAAKMAILKQMAK